MLNLNGKTFKAYKVSYKNKKLYINVNLRFHSISKIDIKRVKNGIEEWNGDWFDNVMGKNIEVKINFNISYHDCTYNSNNYESINQKMNQVNNGYIHVFYDDTQNSAAYVKNYSNGKKYSRNKFFLGIKHNSSFELTPYIMHEFGHCLGLDEGGGDHNPGTKYGFENYKFAMSGADKARPVNQDIAMIMYSFATQYPQHYKTITKENDTVSFVLKLFYSGSD